MALRTRLTRPPVTASRELDIWLGQVQDAINDLPNFSITSYGNLNSTHTGSAGDLAVDLKGGEGHLWIKHDNTSDTSVWAPIALAGYGILYNDEDSATALTVTASNFSTVPAAYSMAYASGISAVLGDEGYFNVDSEGTYQIQFQSSFTADANTVWDCDLFYNGSQTSFGFQHGIGTAILPGSATFLAVAHASSDDSFHVGIAHDNVAAKGITILYSQFYIQKLL